MIVFAFHADFLSDDNNNGNCRARNDLEEERLARIDAEDVVSKLQEQLADVQHAEVTARQAAETRLSSLTQEYESMKLKVSACCIFACCNYTSQKICQPMLGSLLGVSLHNLPV